MRVRLVQGEVRKRDAPAPAATTAGRRRLTAGDAEEAAQTAPRAWQQPSAAHDGRAQDADRRD
ncbi:MAG: hypothetical protein ACOCZ7_02400, partial [Armatimonadota bacterium]